MQTLLKSLLLAIFLTSSCCSSPVDNDGSQKPLWITPLTNGGLIFGTFPITNTDIGVLYIGAEGSTRTLFFLDKNNGNIKWKWSDYFTSTENVYVPEVYTHQSICSMYNIGNVYSIDLTKGTTTWRLSQRGSGIDGISGIGNSLFYSGDTTIEKGQVVEKAMTRILSITQQSGYNLYIKTPLSFLAQNGDTMLLTTRGGLKLSDATAAPTYLMLYNLTKQLLVYDSLQQARTAIHLPEIQNTKVYTCIGGGIQCNDLYTGKLLWRRDFQTSFLFSGLTVSDGKVFAGGEDTNFYCLDAETGATLWQLNGIVGGSHKPFVMNGVVYFTRTLLYAVDIQTGQYLWKRECPEQAQSGSVYFFGRVTGSEGKIYVQSYKSAYCYKAAR